MPGRVIADPLSVEFMLPGEAASYVRRLDDLPNSELARDLAAGLAAATHPHGPIRTRSVAQQYVTTMRRMAFDFEKQRVGGGLSQLSPAALVRYWLECDYHRERRIRAVLRAYAAQGGHLDSAIIRHLDGRRINKAFKSRPNQPYSENEWQHLAVTLDAHIASAWARHQDTMQAAERGSDPRLHSVTADNLAWLLARLGPTGLRDLNDEHGLSVPAAVHAEVMRGLFPDSMTAFAYNTAFAMRTGIVPDGIDSLTADSLRRTSDSTMIVSYRKGRTGGEALNLPRDAVRLIDKWMQHSALLRTHAAALGEKVWIHIGSQRTWLVRTGPLIYSRPRSQSRRQAWVQSSGVTGDNGQPLAIHGGRVRATYHHRRDRSSWTGRTTIDPNHSARVEGDHYLSSHTPAQLEAIDDIIEQSQTDLRRKAEKPIVFAAQDAASFAAEFPAMVEEAGLDADAIARLLSGEQDVFVAACANPTNSPHAPAGQLCPARPWVCLLCPLAAFSPRHLPNLLNLKDYFARQSQRMTTAQFIQIFGPYASRLDDDILPRFPASDIREAAAANSGGHSSQLALHLEEQAQ